MLIKSFETKQEHIEANEPDLELVRKLALRDVKPDEVYLGRMHLANDQVDRAHERFPIEYLERFAKTLPSRSLMGGHNYDTLPLGRFYKASVQKDGGQHYLDAYYYLAASSPYVEQVELGVLSGSSIGYNAGKRVCDLCTKTWSPYGTKDGCEHYPGQEIDGKTVTLTYCPSEAHKAEAMEGSWVWAPCQFGAQSLPKGSHPRAVDLASWQPVDAYSPFPNAGLLDFLKRLQGLPQPGSGDTRMTVEEVQAELQQTKAAHQTEAAKWQQEQAELKKAAAEGEWGREYLKAEIVKMASLLKKADSYATILKHLGENPTVAQLEPIWRELGGGVRRQVPARAGEGGDGRSTAGAGGDAQS